MIDLGLPEQSRSRRVCGQPSFYFEWKQQIIVCTHAVKKPGNKRYQIEIDKVKRLMNQWLEETKQT